MQNKFKIENFEPQKISHAKDILDKYLRQSKRIYREEEELFILQGKTSWWKYIIKNIFRFYK